MILGGGRRGIGQGLLGLQCLAVEGIGVALGVRRYGPEGFLAGYGYGPMPASVLDLPPAFVNGSRISIALR